MVDQNLTQLTATTELADGDLTYAVRDPAGTPADRKITVANLKTALNGGTPVVKYKSTDETVVSNTTLQDDDELFFAIDVDEEWHAIFDVVGHHNSSTRYFQAGVTAPAGATLYYHGESDRSSDQLLESSTVSPSGGFTWYAKQDVNDHLRVYVNVKAGATAGNIQFQWAQNFSSVAEMTVKAGSMLVAHKVA